MTETELVVGQAVVVVEPRKFQGGGEHWRGRIGRLKSISGCFCVVVLQGERDQLGFFADELAPLDETC